MHAPTLTEQKGKCYIENRNQERKDTMKTVLVGLSGGVDSSVCAYLLKKQGYNVIGVTLVMGQSEESVTDAARVAECLDIPFHVVNCKKEFKDTVIDYFLEEYLAGRTPNPCIRCNRCMKWGRMLELADELGAHYIATGHYARIERLPNGRLALKTQLHRERTKRMRYTC